jgi:putative ABC transport system permease protein
MNAFTRLGFREIRKRPGRTLLTLASVVIGVAAVVSVSLTSQSARRAFASLYESMAGRAALEVAAPLGKTIPQEVAAAVEQTAGVAGASPVIQRQTKLILEGRSVALSVRGIDLKRDRAVHDIELESGGEWTKAGEAMLNAAVARNLGLKVGDRAYLLTNSGRERVTIVGLFSSRTTVATGQGASLLIPVTVAQAWFKAPRQFDMIQIVLAPDADEAAVETALREALPEGVLLRTPAARSTMAAETSLSTEQALGMARAFSVLVAVFVITNTFLISVTQRRRQFGIMRAIGATRRQIAGLVYRQALALGIGGTLLGAVTGVFAARYLNDMMSTLYGTELPPVELSWGPFLWAMAFGMGISLIGAAFPAYKAAHLAPLDAMRDVLAEEIEGVQRWLALVGVAVVLGCGGVMTASILGRLAPEHAVWSAVLLLVGLVLLLPAALGPLSRAVAALAPRWLRVESRLASRHMLIHRSRTTLTVGVVFVAAASALGLANTVIDNIANVRNWAKKTIIADFFVRATAPDMATGLSADLPDGIDAEVLAVPGVEKIDGVRLVSAEAAGQQIILIVRGFNDADLQAFDLVAGDPDDVRAKLRAGEVVLGSVFAERAGLKAGDDVPLVTDRGERKFRVAAIANDYQAGGLTMSMERGVAERELGIGGVDAYAVKVDHARLAEARAGLEALGGKYGLLVQSFSDIQDEIDLMIAGIEAGLWGMVVLGLVVAMFGVANTLTMTVLEQTFELGLLRIVAATRSQVRKMIFAQAVLMGLLALVPGVIAGVGVAYLINLATMPVIGHPVEFTLRPGLLAGGVAAGLAVMVLAAWPPAERAARLELTAALKLR